jgi:RNA polymerase-binding transcription factor DksA
MHDTIKSVLTLRLHELKSSLSHHEKETTQLLPPQASESAYLRNEIETLEVEERLEAEEIQLIQKALDRLERGTYGTCLSCHKPIAKKRLLAVPETSFCKPCKTSGEPLRQRDGNWAY